MKRYRTSSFVVFVAALLVGGCAFDDGNPWGVASFDVSTSFDPPASRLEDGALKTAKGYLVEVDRLEATYDAVELEIATGGASEAFDPADPPDGYSLCHNGHCHAATGELVPYEEIAVEQSGGDFVVTQALTGSVELGESAAPLPTGTCSNDCQLIRGGLGLVRLSLTRVHLAATVTDAAGEMELVEVDLELPVNARLETPLEGTVGPGEPGAVNMDIQFSLPSEFLDGVEFVELEVSEGIASQATVALIRDAIQHNGLLDVEVERAEL